MIKSFYHLINIKFIILLIIMFIASPTLGGKNTYTICLIYSHYLTMYMNNVFLLMIYQWTYQINRLQPFFITRIQEENFYLYSFISIISISSIYTLIIYIGYYFFFGAILPQDLTITIYFMIINFIILILESILIYIQIGKNKNFLYLALPIMINVIFHITFITIF